MLLLAESPSVLDVIISLVLIFLLYSILVSILTEIAATTFSLRARLLDWSISRMLTDHKDDKNKFMSFFENILIGIKRLFKTNREHLYEAFYTHPSIKQMGRDGMHKAPSYISSDTFATVVFEELLAEGARKFKAEDEADELDDPMDDKTFTDMELLEKAFEKDDDGNASAFIPTETRKNLKLILRRSQNDLDKFKAGLQKWFDETMNQTSGWYRVKMRYVSFFLGFIVAMTFNADSIGLTKKLSKNPEMVETLVAQAARLSEDTTFRNLVYKDTLTFKSYDSSEVALLKDEMAATNGLLYLTPEETKIYHPKNPWLWSFLGWLIMALAVSFGAPFWFDLLNKFIKLRTSIPAGTSGSGSGGGASGGSDQAPGTVTKG